MLSAIVQRNPGSATDTYIVPNLYGGPGFLLRAFFCLGACVMAFMYCLPVLCIDGTFLTGRYKGTILTAIGDNCNKQLVLIAFAFVENENTESWYWFNHNTRFSHNTRLLCCICHCFSLLKYLVYSKGLSVIYRSSTNALGLCFVIVALFTKLYCKPVIYVS